MLWVISLLFTSCNNDDDEWCIYIALYCVLLYTKALYNHVGGGSLLNHHQCVASTWMMWRLPQDNGTSALTTHQLQVERRERDSDYAGKKAVLLKTAVITEYFCA